MLKIIRLIAFIVGISAMWSVYSRPEVRDAIMMGITGSVYESDYEYDDYDDDDEDHYAYDDYDSDYDY